MTDDVAKIAASRERDAVVHWLRVMSDRARSYGLGEDAAEIYRSAANGIANGEHLGELDQL